MISRASRAHRATATPRNGFGLLELMIGLVILTSGMLAGAALLGSTGELRRLAQSRSEMTVLAEAKVDELRAYGMTAATDTLRAKLAIGGSLTTLVTSYSDTATWSTGRAYQRRWQVSAGTLPDARRIAVRMLPVGDGTNAVKSLDFTTMVLLR